MLWVRTIDTRGVGYELSDLVEGLSYSNVNPGGDEVANFVYKRPWRAAVPEVAQGATLQIGYGVDVLWQGRIEEHGRGGDSAEEIAVTAYGKGAALKDNTFVEIYRDADLGHWQEMSRTRRLVLLGAGWNVLGFTTEPDATGSPALVMDGSGRWATSAISEAVYDAGEDARLGYVGFTWTAENHGSGLTAATWAGRISGYDDDALSGGVAGTDVLDGSASGAAIEAAPLNKRVAVINFQYVGASSNDVTRKWTLIVAVYGDHGLPFGANGGFTVSQMVADIVGRVEGVSARRIDSQTYEVLQAVFREPVRHEDAISELNAYEGCDWGTWGPDSPLDPSTDGRFDFTDLDLTTQHWTAPREDFEGLDLQSEVAALFDTVKLSYTDPAGVARTVTRSVRVEELERAGLSPKTRDISAGTLTDAAARTLADTLLYLSGGFAPARGSATIERPLRHHERGMLPPCYLRADGSNLRIPDILPSTTLFDLSTAPDRRTTFPIKRVTVSASGQKLSASVEIDQTNDLLDVLQARLGLSSEVVA